MVWHFTLNFMDICNCLCFTAETQRQRLVTKVDDHDSLHSRDRDSPPVCELVCRTCFINQGRVLDEKKPIPDRCPDHRHYPILVWRQYGRLVEVRPRPPNAARSGAFVVCNRRTNCGGRHRCRRPHSDEERDAWTWDRDGGVAADRCSIQHYSIATVLCF